MRPLLKLVPLAFLVGCSAFPSYQTPFSVRNPLIYGAMKARDGTTDTTYLAEKAQAFVDAYKAARDGESDATIKKYLGTGITYSHLLCKDYFDKLTLTKAHRDFAKKETNLTAGLASAVMGLAKASSSAVAGTGALFSFGEASFDSYNESFIVSPDISNLERLVKEKQQEEEAILYKRLNATSGKWPDKIETLDQAERSLSGYIFHCTANGIRILLDSSVQQKAKDVQNNTIKIQKDTTTPPSALESK